MLSLFFAGLFIAAGSNASPCKVASVSSAASPASSSSGTTSTGLPPGAQEKVALGSTNKGTQLISNPSSPAASGSCPPGFINTVFNTDAPAEKGWPETVWGSLSSNSVSNWIGFSLGTLDTKSTYNVNGSPAATNPALNNAQIHLLMDPRDTDAAVTMVQGDSAPQYLELFNEPDYSYAGITPLTDPVTAAQNLAQMFNIPHPNTTYIAPALAAPNSQWLPTFRDNCNNCFDQIPIVAMHIYDPDVASVISGIQAFHATWPNQKIWITELAPSRNDCTLTPTANGPGSIGDYITTLIPKIVALGYVEKIFWNSGEWDASINDAPTVCNPSLTDGNGGATAVLKVLGQVCGGSAAGGSATS